MYMQQNQPQNPMAAEPVPGLLARIGAPIVVSMILQAAYNVVDSAYLARMVSGGETALTALSLAFPVAAGLRRGRAVCPAAGGAVLAVCYHPCHVRGLHAHRFAGLFVCWAVHRVPGCVPGAGMRCGVTCDLAVPAGIVCTAPGLGTDLPGDRPGKCRPRLVAPGPWRSRHVSGSAGAVREAREEEDGVLKEKRRFTVLK